MIRARIFLVMLFVLHLLPQVTRAELDTSALLERAGDCYASGRYLEALSFYRDCADNAGSHVDLAAALYGQALIYDTYLGDPERALACYRTHALLRGGDSASALHMSARILCGLQRYGEFRACCRRLVKRFPEYALEHGIDAEGEAIRLSGCSGRVRLFEARRLRDFQGMVRVLIVDSEGPVEISCEEGLRVEMASHEQAWGRHDEALVVHADNGSLFVNGAPCGRTELKVLPLARNRLRINGRRYRSWVMVRAEKGRVIVVSHVSLEHYLYGVLPREVYASWPSSALRAQAIAARTYALYHIIMRRHSAYDVLSTTSSQVYGGMEQERASTNAAVDATRGMVLFSGTRLALTLYHANSGGVVEAAADLWGGRVPYLQRLVDTPSLEGRSVEWVCEIGVAVALKRLADFGCELASLDAVEPVRRSGSGRVQQIVLRDQTSAVMLSGNSLRLMLGPSVVKSTRFIVLLSDGILSFTGTGYGHGVGMSQWGAYALARSGLGHQAILSHYYPGTHLAPWRPSESPHSAIRQ